MILTVSSHSVSQWGSTALIEATHKEHADVVQLLLSSGAQVDLQNMVRHNINYSRTLVNPLVTAVILHQPRQLLHNQRYYSEVKESSYAYS